MKKKAVDNHRNRPYFSSIILAFNGLTHARDSRSNTLELTASPNTAA